MNDLARLAHAFAVIADDAGRLILKIKSSGIEIRTKSDKSPVTEADQAAERHILASLQAILPGVPVIAEESAAAGHIPRIGSSFLLVDPLDGTSEFIAGRPEYTVNIALIENGVPIVGAIGAPELGQTFAGAPGWAGRRDGGGAFRDIATRAMASPPVAVTSLSHCDTDTDAWLERWPGHTRCGVGSSLKFALLAEGKADVYPRFGTTCEWDTAAGHAILSAAGGAVTTPDGNAFTYGKADSGYRNGPFIAWGRPPSA